MSRCYRTRCLTKTEMWIFNCWYFLLLFCSSALLRDVMVCTIFHVQPSIENNKQLKEYKKQRSKERKTFHSFILLTILWQRWFCCWLILLPLSFDGTSLFFFLLVLLAPSFRWVAFATDTIGSSLKFAGAYSRNPPFSPQYIENASWWVSWVLNVGRP